MRDSTWPVITHLVGNTGAPSCLRPDPRNERSRRAIMRLGAHLDGVVRADRIALDGADKVHLAINYARCRADGTEYYAFPSLWIFTRIDGHWGVQFRSSFLSGPGARGEAVE